MPPAGQSEFYGSVVLKRVPLDLAAAIAKDLGDETESITDVVTQPGASEDRVELRATVWHRDAAGAMVLLALGVRRLIHKHGAMPHAVAVQGAEAT